MSEMLNTLFWDCEGLQDKIDKFCETLPGFLEAREELEAIEKEIAYVAGFDLYDRFERSLFRYSELELHAYYLFGLGLRQEVLEAMGAQI